MTHVHKLKLDDIIIYLTLNINLIRDHRRIEINDNSYSFKTCVVKIINYLEVPVRHTGWNLPGTAPVGLRPVACMVRQPDRVVDPWRHCCPGMAGWMAVTSCRWASAFRSFPQAASERPEGMTRIQRPGPSPLHDVHQNLIQNIIYCISRCCVARISSKTKDYLNIIPWGGIGWPGPKAIPGWPWYRPGSMQTGRVGIRAIPGRWRMNIACDAPPCWRYWPWLGALVRRALLSTMRGFVIAPYPRPAAVGTWASTVGLPHDRE